MALTRQRLDTMQCAGPGCTEKHGALWFHGVCHPSAPTRARYESGVVTISCFTCKKVVVEIAVAAVLPVVTREDRDYLDPVLGSPFMAGLMELDRGLWEHAGTAVTTAFLAGKESEHGQAQR